MCFASKYVISQTFARRPSYNVTLGRSSSEEHTTDTWSSRPCVMCNMLSTLTTRPIRQCETYLIIPISIAMLQTFTYKDAEHLHALQLIMQHVAEITCSPGSSCAP